MSAALQNRQGLTTDKIPIFILFSRTRVAIVLNSIGVLASSAYAENALNAAKSMLDGIERVGYSVQQRRLCGVQEDQMSEHQRVYNSGLWLAKIFAALPNTLETAVFQAKLTPSAVEAAFSEGVARANREPHPTAVICVEARQKLANGEAVAKRVADEANARTKMSSGQSFALNVPAFGFARKPYRRCMPQNSPLRKPWVLDGPLISRGDNEPIADVAQARLGTVAHGSAIEFLDLECSEFFLRNLAGEDYSMSPSLPVF